MDRSLNERIDTIKKDKDRNGMDELIEEYIPFIINTISKFLNRYIDVDNNEEFSVGLSAFHEAVERFNPERGNFLSYARLIIESRLKDYHRKQKEVVYLEDHEVEAPEVNFDIHFEIEAFDKELKAFKLSFSKLVSEAPKHRDTREKLLRVCHEVATDNSLMELIREKKRLPIKKIALKVGQSEKVIKGNKIFILSTVILITGDYESIKSFVDLRGE